MKTILALVVALVLCSPVSARCVKVKAGKAKAVKVLKRHPVRNLVHRVFHRR